MRNHQTIVFLKKHTGRILATLIIVAVAAIPALSLADDGPPPFTFNERCMPYEIDPDFMRANGVDPDKIISAFVANGDGVAGPEDVSGTGNNGLFLPMDRGF